MSHHCCKRKNPPPGRLSINLLQAQDGASSDISSDYELTEHRLASFSLSPEFHSSINCKASLTTSAWFRFLIACQTIIVPLYPKHRTFAQGPDWSERKYFC